MMARLLLFTTEVRKKLACFACAGLLILAGCQGQAPPAPSPEQVIEQSRQTVQQAEAVIEKVKEDTQAAEAKIAAVKSDPLKDVAPPGPVVPYFNPLSEAEITDGWISLFDGHTLIGWEPNNTEVNWAVTDDVAGWRGGVISADSGPIGLLLTYTPFADYQFRCDYRMAAGGNSGVFLRTLKDPKDVQKDCYEINIVDEHPAGFLTGSIVGHQKTAEPIKGSGDWHTFLLTADGTKITVAIDGKEVSSFDDTRPEARRSGYIGLQKNVGKAEFKNIALKPLNQKPLFNGTDLTGWRTVPGSKGEFTVEEGTIHVKGGEGFLESEGQYKDFVLQAQARTNADAVNTGIFFRAEAGTEKAKSNGYEMQVDNTFLPAERPADDVPFPGPSAVRALQQMAKMNLMGGPKNAGTGAIFRRVNARRIVSFDNEWATVTLIASGPRFSTYVNGYAVVHWEDTRKPDPNPRKGQRLDAGHLSLQGHDPTTDASFKALSISEIP